MSGTRSTTHKAMQIVRCTSNMNWNTSTKQIGRRHPAEQQQLFEVAVTIAWLVWEVIFLTSSTHCRKSGPREQCIPTAASGRRHHKGSRKVVCHKLSYAWKLYSQQQFCTGFFEEHKSHRLLLLLVSCTTKTPSSSTEQSPQGSSMLLKARWVHITHG